MKTAQDLVRETRNLLASYLPADRSLSCEELLDRLVGLYDSADARAVLNGEPDVFDAELICTQPISRPVLRLVKSDNAERGGGKPAHGAGAPKAGGDQQH